VHHRVLSRRRSTNTPARPATGQAASSDTIARSGQTEEAFIARFLPAAEQAAAGHDLLAESYAAVPALDPVKVRDAKFAYGLDVIFDGLALQLPDDR
jgi:hypothetical protein